MLFTVPSSLSYTHRPRHKYTDAAGCHHSDVTVVGPIWELAHGLKQGAIVGIYGRQLKDTEGVRGFRYESEVVMVHKHVCTLLEQGR